MAGIVPGLNLKGMARGLSSLASDGLARHGGTMALGAIGGYAASDEGFMSTTAGMVGGAALGLAASRGAFGSSVKAASRGFNSRTAMAANTAMEVGRAGYSGAKMYCNKAMNSIKSSMKG